MASLVYKRNSVYSKTPILPELYNPYNLVFLVSLSYIFKQFS